MTINFQRNQLVVDGHSVKFSWSILDAVENDKSVYVLLDPDSYLLNHEYKEMLRKGAPAIHNLIAISKSGEKLWEAEFPKTLDYYYRMVSSRPLVVVSYSSYKCEINCDTGEIVKKEFLK